MSQHRALSAIARDIREDYATQGKPVYFAAKPYVDAMAGMGQVTEAYFSEDGHHIVSYALSNLRYWRGDTAKTVKAEMKAILATRK